MGLFDSLMIPCPKCGTRVEHQSKACECQMRVYTLDTAPAEILIDIMNEPNYCEKCGNWFAMIDPRYPPGRKPKPNLRAANVRTPDNPMTHSQGMRWWPDDRPFSYDDLIDPPKGPPHANTI